MSSNDWSLLIVGVVAGAWFSFLGTHSTMRIAKETTMVEYSCGQYNQQTGKFEAIKRGEE